MFTVFSLWGFCTNAPGFQSGPGSPANPLPNPNPFSLASSPPDRTCDAKGLSVLPFKTLQCLAPASATQPLLGSKSNFREVVWRHQDNLKETLQGKENLAVTRSGLKVSIQELSFQKMLRARVPEEGNRAIPGLGVERMHTDKQEAGEEGMCEAEKRHL